MVKLVIFDFDGTLADTAPGIHMALNLVLSERGLPPVSLEESKKMIGGGVRHLVEKLKAHGYSSLPTVDELSERFHFHYHECYETDSSLYPGVLDTLTRIKCEMAILSNKPEQYLVPLLPDLQLNQFNWLSVVGGDTFKTKKPDPFVFESIIKKSSFNKSEVLMVGDAEPDIAGATATGIASCGVTYGYTPSEELKALGPTYTIDRFSEVLRYL